MVQPIMDFDEIGTRRAGEHRGGRPQKYVLDERGRRLLLGMYDGSSENITRLEQMLTVPRSVVKKWASELGLTPQKAPAWTEKEIQYLETSIKKKSLDTIAKHLKRTKTAVKVKARRLNLSRVHSNGYTMLDVKLALGNDTKTISKWIEKDWLKGKRQGPNTPVWLFTDKNIRDFVIAHPNEIDPRRCDWIWMVDLLAGGDHCGIGPLDKNRGKEEKDEHE